MDRDRLVGSEIPPPDMKRDVLLCDLQALRRRADDSGPPELIPKTDTATATASSKLFDAAVNRSVVNPEYFCRRLANIGAGHRVVTINRPL